MDIFFSNEHELWGDVETALGEYNVNHIIDWCAPDEKFDDDHPTRSIAAVEDGPDNLFYPTLEEFKALFPDWVDSILLNKACPIFKLSKVALYLTFNYTETLEKTYGVPKENVCHIHGNRIEGRPYVMGHSGERAEDSEYREHDQYWMNDTREKVITRMNHEVKPTGALIKANKAFFDSLSDIQQIIVIGHSLQPVDWPYFEKIAKSVSQSAKWIFTYYAPKTDVENAKALIDHLSLKHTELSVIDSLLR